MRINVRVMATREQILRGTTLRLELPSPSCVGDVLHRLVDQDRSLLGPVLEAGTALSVRPGFALLLNGVNVLHAPHGLETAVADGDILALIHGITGG